MDLPPPVQKVFFLVCLVAICPAVSANPIIHHATILYFEQENQSINATIIYSMSCTGHRCREWDCSAPEDKRSPAEYPQELLFRSSGICPPSYGCIIGEDKETARNVGFHLDSCTISGEASGRKFFMENNTGMQHGCFLTGFWDGDGRRYTDFCEMHVSLPPGLDLPVMPIAPGKTIKSGSAETYPDIYMKKEWIDEMYCNIASIFGATC